MLRRIDGLKEERETSKRDFETRKPTSGFDWFVYIVILPRKLCNTLDVAATGDSSVKQDFYTNAECHEGGRYKTVSLV